MKLDLPTIEALEKKAKRRIIQGKIKEAIEDLKIIITALRENHQYERADILEKTMYQFMLENASSL